MQVYQVGTANAPCVLLLQSENSPVVLPRKLLQHYRFLIPTLRGSPQDLDDVRALMKPQGKVHALCATAACWTLAEQVAGSLSEPVFLAECGSGRPGGMLIPELEQRIVVEQNEEGT